MEPKHPSFASTVVLCKTEAGRTGDYASPGLVESVVATLDRLSWSPDLPDKARVVLKPNWVKEHDERHPGSNSWEHVVTHPTVIEGVIQWIAPKLGIGSQIVVCDAPQTDSSFTKIRQYCRLDEMIARSQQCFPDVTIQLLDLRPEEWHALDGITVSKSVLPGDPRGRTEVALNAASEFVGFSGEGKLYGASYDMEETNARHHGERHEYMLCRTPMEADLLINIPKLKTHKKVGLTCALKNLVGINANKNWLPHHTEGTPEHGGDQFAAATVKATLEHSIVGSVKRMVKGNYFLSRLIVPLKKLARLYFGDTQKVVRSGNWHGNDTCWRMVLDLNKCLFHYDADGNRRMGPRQYLAVVDGIIGGEGNGPMAPDPKPCGVIIAGTNPVAVDCTAASVMGFEWQNLRMLAGAFQCHKLPLVDFAYDDITVESNVPEWNGPLWELQFPFRFRPHFGWVGAIEKDAQTHGPGR